VKVGIVGFRGAGKTTIFNALTGLHAQVGGYGDASRPNLGVIKVPDPRVGALAEIHAPKKVTYAEIGFVDVPGRGEERAALDPGTLVHMRDVDALAHVVAAFSGAEGTTSAGAVSPRAQLDNFIAELILADLAVIEKRLERLLKEKGKDRERQLLERCRQHLAAEQPLRSCELAREEETALAGFNLVSRMPLLVLLNVDEGVGTAVPADVAAWAAEHGVEVVPVPGKTEMELAELEEADRTAFLAELGIAEPAKNRFIRAAYGLLDLVSFLTAGPDECRAWPIRRGTRAVKAAGKIHSDIERGFIRAEVIPFEEFMRYRSEARCREAGKLRLEGKDYVVVDGDIIHFRFNV
jgi:GTP-binding protein YchF